MKEMKANEMTSMQRVLTTLSHKEPDRVPLFLLLTMHGARELGLSIKEYYSSGEHVVAGQLKMLKKYKHDCIVPFFYASIETEAFGGEVIYTEDGPPNAGTPIIINFDDIKNLRAPSVNDSVVLRKVLIATEKLKREVKDEVPIIGVVMSPFSLPVMQLGFERYFELICFYPDLFLKLMQINEEFCVEWANAQLAAGATAICYFDPVSSQTIIPREKYLETGHTIAKRTIGRIKGPTATHFASGRCMGIVNDVALTGTAVIGTSSMEDPGLMKKACRGKLTMLGNLNGVEMRRWSTEEATEKVKEIIHKAAPGGGFILSDNHGEIPYQVPENVLFAISDAVHKYGNYPINID
jgi:uroporphyrinogen decarboxylase